MDAARLLEQIQMLEEQVQTLQVDKSRLLSEKSLQELEIKSLRAKVDDLLRRLYGQSSEKLPPQQIQMLMEGLETLAQSFAPLPSTPKAKADFKERSSSPREPRGLPRNLETKEILLEPDEVKAAPGQWQKIGQEVTEELDYVPPQYLRNLYIRPKYVRKAAARSEPSPSDVVSEVLAELEAKPVVIAPLPPRLLEKSFVGPGFLTHVIISKFEDHLPLYRQEKILRERHGLKVSRQSLCEWVGVGAWWLKPIYEEMRKGLLQAGYLQADETPINYLDPDRPGKAHKGFLWTYSKPGGDVLFDWQTTRGKEAPQKFLQGFKGTLQTDGYGVYESLAKDRPQELTLVGCWAHVRRGFFEAKDQDRRAAWFLGQMAQLYGVEKRLRAQRAGPRLRQARRSAEVKPVLERLRQALEKVRPKVLPQSKLGQAIGYARNQWDTLVRYVEDGRLEIDNNLIENAIRPTALGKKNFLFIGHPEAGWHSAVIYSILGSCRRHGINPFEYLRDVLSRLPGANSKEIPELTPAAWAKARKKPQTKRQGAPAFVAVSPSYI